MSRKGNVLTFFFARVMGGLMFLIPFLVLLLLLREVLRFVGKILGPLARLLPTAGLTGPAADYLVAAIATLIFAFLFGLLAATRTGRQFGAKVERIALGRIPGYTLFKSFLRLPTDDDDEHVKVLLVTLDEAWLFGFLIEEMPDGMLAVFVPGVPSPISGSLYFFNESQVRRTDITVREAVRVLARLGVGAGPFISGRLTKA